MFRPRKDKFSDEEILTALRQDNSQRAKVLAYLYQAYQRMILNMVRKHGGGEDEAREVLHEGLIRLERSVRTGLYRGEAKISTYFYQICRNFWNRSRQTYRTDSLSILYESSIEDESENMLQLLQREDFRVQVQGILSRMSHRCYQLLLWTDGENSPMKEVAEKLGYESIQAARNQKTRCRKRLRDMISDNPTFRALVDELLDTNDLEEKSWK